MFLANYSDGLTDLPLDAYVDHFVAQERIGSFLAVKPSQSYHVVQSQAGLATGIQPMSDTGIRINGGYFAFRQKIFDYMEDGEELVVESFQRLIAKEQLLAYECPGYWACMDTFKDRQQLEDQYTRGAQSAAPSTSIHRGKIRGAASESSLARHA